jgi:hypothetical protein
MIHGVQTGDLVPKSEQFMDVIEQIRRDYNKHRGDISFQFGCIDPTWSGTVKSLKNDDSITQTLIQGKKKLNENMRQLYGLVPSWREHMPDTTIQIDVSQ